MKVLNLQCAAEHGFEGWFGSEDDFVAQSERADIACPICSSTDITRLPSAPRLAISRHAPPCEVSPPASPSAGSSNQLATRQSQWLRAVQHVIKNTEDVGERFAEEARRIHYGEVEERGIRGQTSGDEARALRDEGIEVMALSIPDAMKGPVQ